MPDQLSKKEMAERYGYVVSFFKADKELWKLFNEAVTKNWTDQEFEAQFIQTDFYTKNSDTYRQMWDLKTSDPGTFEDRVAKQASYVEHLATSLGADLSKKQRAKIAEDAVMYGWTPLDMRQKLGKYVETVKDTNFFGGEAGDHQAQLHKIAFDYGIKVSNKTIEKWTVDMVRGDATLNDFAAVIKDQSAALYPAYRQQIRKGATMRQIAEPYVQAMAETLELDPMNIDLYDKHVQRALKHENADRTESGGSPEYNMYDFQSQLRKDARWKRTKNAQDQMANMVAQVRSDWGM